MKKKYAIWEPVTREDQLKEGTVIKIVGVNPKYSYIWIMVKKVIKLDSGTKIVINKEKNYYFNLTRFLKKEKFSSLWVKELYVKTGEKLSNNMDRTKEITCINCGEKSVKDYRSKAIKYCSRECYGDAKRGISKDEYKLKYKG